MLLILIHESLKISKRVEPRYILLFAHLILFPPFHVLSHSEEGPVIYRVHGLYPTSLILSNDVSPVGFLAWTPLSAISMLLSEGPTEAVEVVDGQDDTGELEA